MFHWWSLRYKSWLRIWKVFKYQGDHVTFLNLDITIKKGTFTYKLFNERDLLLFSAVKMSHIESNIPPNIFYSTIKDELLRIARLTLCLKDYVPKTKELLKRMNSFLTNIYKICQQYCRPAFCFRAIINQTNLNAKPFCLWGSPSSGARKMKFSHEKTRSRNNFRLSAKANWKLVITGRKKIILH